MRIGYNLLLWHILGKIKSGCFRRKILSLYFFLHWAKSHFYSVSQLPHCSHPTSPQFIQEKKVGIGLGGPGIHLVLMESSSSCCTIPFLLRHPRAFLGGCVQGGTGPSTAVWGLSGTTGFCFSSYVLGGKHWVVLVIKNPNSFNCPGWIK